MKMNIYVVTHKIIDNPLPDNYSYIMVNANKTSHNYKYGDNVGDNISEKNPNYCELTAGYYIWKNDHENDIVGIAHYRRFLTTNRFSSNIKSYVNEKNICRDLKKYDFISTKPYKTKMTVKEHMGLNVREKDLVLLRKAINEVCPDYLESYDKVVNGHQSYLLNMIITSKNNYDDYYKWLFSVLEHMEKEVDMTGYSVQEQRLYGFLSERLFTVYVLKNNFKVKSYPTTIVGESKLKLTKNKILKKLRLKKD
ncbi:MAG: DUF4422 domain-containing protein [Acholeplasmatales bacterium]|nr:DUF4422 domain-containing protein [Acholeplasmatales bacterium]